MEKRYLRVLCLTAALIAAVPIVSALIPHAEPDACAMLTATQKTRYANHTPIEGIEKVINQKRGVLKCQYSFAGVGGATGAYKLKDENGDPCVIPNKAIVTQVYTDTVTAPTSATATASLALGINTTTDLKGTTAVSGSGAAQFAGVQAATPVGTAATMVKATADRFVTLTIATENLTAGVINAFIEFVLSD